MMATLSSRSSAAVNPSPPKLLARSVSLPTTSATLVKSIVLPGSVKSVSRPERTDTSPRTTPVSATVKPSATRLAPMPLLLVKSEFGPTPASSRNAPPAPTFAVRSSVILIPSIPVMLAVWLLRLFVPLGVIGARAPKTMSPDSAKSAICWPASGTIPLSRIAWNAVAAIRIWTALN